MIYKNILERIGDTPIVGIKELGPNDNNLFMKLEGNNPTGSIKDRAALAIIKDKINKGELTREKTILDASSGSFACAMSFIGNFLGYSVTTVVGNKMTNDKYEFVKFFGAECIKYDANFTIESNRYCRNELLKSDPEKYCFLDQLHNPMNPLIHYQTTAPEIIEALPEVSAVSFSAGSGGTLCGISRFFKEFYPHVKMVEVGAASGTKIPGTAAFQDGEYITPFIDEYLANNRIDYRAEVSEHDAKKKVKLLRESGVYCGIQTGAVYQGTLDAIDKLSIKGPVVMISGDSGWKNTEKLSKLI